MEDKFVSFRLVDKVAVVTGPSQASAIFNLSLAHCSNIQFIDLVGSQESLRWGLEAVATSGRMVVLTTFRQVKIPLDPRELVFREVTVQGSRYASKAELLEPAKLVTSGRLKPIVTHVVPPEEVPQVHRKLQAGSLIGRGAVIWPH